MVFPESLSMGLAVECGFFVQCGQNARAAASVRRQGLDRPIDRPIGHPIYYPRMKFWRHQQDARSATRQLLWGFALAVLLLVGTVHGGLVLAWLLLSWGMGGDWPFPAGFAAVNIGMTLFFVLGGWWVETDQLRAGGVRLAQRIGAREVRPERSLAEQTLANVVQELSIAAHMRPPAAMVLPRTGAINAFAAGWDEGDAIVAVTQGALDHLSREELQGMVAHELSHLHEGDTRLKMQLAGMVYGLELVYQLGESMCGRGGAMWWFGSAIKGAGFAGWLAGRCLKAAVSRQREYLADARAVQWTRSKEGLGGVLRKVMGQRQAAGYDPRRSQYALGHHAVQHMLLVDVQGSHRWAQRLASHPALADRVRRIYGRAMPPLGLGQGAASSAAER